LRLAHGQAEIDRRRDFDYMVAFDRSFNAPRCHLCVNHINFLADIVVGDAWLAGTSKTKTGVSVVVCRTDQSVEMMQSLERRGSIRCKEVSEQEIVESQSRNLVYGDFAYAYADYLQEIGLFRPDLTGPNRPSAKPVRRRSVARFHRETLRKARLRDRGMYRTLWWRKVVRDVPRYAVRFLRKLVQRRVWAGSHRRLGNVIEPSGFR
jgi:hypothetical protein